MLMTKTKTSAAHSPLSSLLAFALVGATLALAGCSEEGGKVEQAEKAERVEKQTTAASKTTEASPSSETVAAEKPKVAEESAASEETVATEEQAEFVPVDAAHRLIRPQYHLKRSNGNVVVFDGGAEGQVVDSGDLLNSNGDKQGRVTFLTDEGELIILNDDSMLPEDGFVFMPYYENTGGSADILFLGLFQVKDGELSETDTVAIDDRAWFVDLEYQGEGQYTVHALTHGPQQTMADEPAVGLNVSFQRSGSAMIDEVTEVEGADPQTNSGGTPVDEKGLGD